MNFVTFYKNILTVTLLLKTRTVFELKKDDGALKELELYLNIKRLQFILS